MGYWKTYIRYFRGRYRNLTLSVALSILQSLLVLPVVILVKRVFDSALPGKDFPLLVIICTAISSLYLLNGGVALLTRYLSLKTIKNVIRHIRDLVVKKFYFLPKQYYSGADRIKLHAGLVQDTFRIDVMSNGLVVQLLPSALTGSGLLLILLYLDPVLFLVVMAVSPFLFVFSKYVGRILKGKVNLYHREFESFSKRIMVLLDIMDLTRASVFEKKEISTQSAIHERLEKKSFDQAWVGALFRIFNETSASVYGIIVLAAGGFRVMNGTMTLGDLFAFITALGLLKKYAVTVSGVLPQVIEGYESLKCVLDFLRCEEDMPYKNTRELEFRGGISLESVCFNYGDRAILRDLTFSISSGEVVCITGPSGSGKSTIVNLILGFFRPLSGILKADDTPYDGFDIRCLLRKTGVVFQDTVIFPGSIRENITYGTDGYDPAWLDEVLERTGCSDFSRRLPGGLDTDIGTRGEKLSGGEVQRIAIARAMLRDCRLMILDEPLVHLDRELTGKILEDIRSRRPGISFLIISHDQEAESLADTVYELKDGKLERMSRGRERG